MDRRGAPPSRRMGRRRPDDAAPYLLTPKHPCCCVVSCSRPPPSCATPPRHPQDDRPFGGGRSPLLNGPLKNGGNAPLFTQRDRRLSSLSGTWNTPATPRPMMMCCSPPGASMRAWRAMDRGYQWEIRMSINHGRCFRTSSSSPLFELDPFDIFQKPL